MVRRRKTGVLRQSSRPLGRHCLNSHPFGYPGTACSSSRCRSCGWLNAPRARQQQPRNGLWNDSSIGDTVSKDDDGTWRSRGCGDRRRGSVPVDGRRSWRNPHWNINRADGGKLWSRSRRRGRVGSWSALEKTGWSPFRGSRDRNPQVIHDFDCETGFFLQHRPGSAPGKVYQVNRPEDRDGPLDYIAHRMAFAEDPSLSVDRVTRRIHHLCGDRDDGVGLNEHAIELQLHPALSHEMAWILVVFEPSLQIAVVRKKEAAVPFSVADLAENRIAGSCVFRGKLWLCNGALDQRASRDKLLTGISS